ncbi:LacI family DNA-binding transcriptional regulator [Peloplasma aerotolerans]|uniref:LacI family DNA-binding transcriptional regulator n=1 Tax=Peloplasma aerotolerans TaxID=3044389 RepID=A0AAW6U4G8_9MOLU|nr:LacI family DNA-binding transcriptional regulator [Mariniplasma sp. M4Ah]MDI6452807.1 LacI family DNA-binding transcriptional regulator [Mariniplasma sp. M4Ah]
MNKKKVTMEDIANELKISKVSVYKALNDKHDISEELKRKVFDCAVRLNYKYIDPLVKQCRNFYYIIPKRFMSSTEQFYFGIFKELSKILSDIGATIEIHIADQDFSPKDFNTNVRAYRHEKAKTYGVFWAGIIPAQTLESFLDIDIPIICIDNYIQNRTGSFIYIDDYHAGYEMTEFLIQQGHRNICFVIETAISTNIDKFYGFQKALYEYKIPFTPSMHINLSLANMQNFKYFNIPSPLPTAFLFDSDYSAQNFLITMISKGYDIPKDFSVASFDNTSLCEETIPRLTSIGVEPKEIANAAYRMMLKRLSSTHIKPYMMILYSSITIRDSVGTCRETSIE